MLWQLTNYGFVVFQHVLFAEFYMPQKCAFDELYFQRLATGGFSCSKTRHYRSRSFPVPEMPSEEWVNVPCLFLQNEMGLYKELDPQP